MTNSKASKHVLLSRLCNSCGGDFKVHGVFDSKEAAKDASNNDENYVARCADYLIVSVGDGCASATWTDIEYGLEWEVEDDD